MQDTSPQHVLALYKEDDDFARQAICHLEEAEFVPWNPFEKKQKVDELCDAKRCMASLKVLLVHPPIVRIDKLASGEPFPEEVLRCLRLFMLKFAGNRH